MFDQLSDGVDEQVARGLNQDLINVSDVEDIVGKEYIIYPQQVINELSTGKVTYCEALKSSTNEEFYAIIFDRAYHPDVARLIAMSEYMTDAFIKPIKMSYTKLSTTQVRHLVLIIPKFNFQDTLKNRLNRIGRANISYIINTLLPLFVKLIDFADKKSFNIGNINPDNIIFIEDKPTLREPYIDYPHANQSSYFLAPELLDTDSNCRKLKTSSADVFAAGVTILNTYFGDNFTNESNELIKEQRLNSGSFSAFIGKQRLNDDIKNQVKGCLADNVVERWKLKNLKDWQSGKPTKANVALSTSATESFAPVSFNGKNYSRYRSLASALCANWEKGTNFLSEDRVLKWIQRGTGKSKIIDNLDELVSRESGNQAYVKSFVDKDLRLTKALQILDSQGPLRYADFSSHPSSFNTLFYNAYINNDKSTLDTIIKIAIKKGWEEFEQYDMDFHFDEESIDALTEIQSFYNASIIGCGNERVLYFLNPTLPCQSPIVSKEYIVNLKDLIITLDKLAGSSSEKTIFDKHIISFIAAKINLKRDTYMNLLRNIPIESENYVISGLIVSVLTLKHLNDNLELANLANLLGQEAVTYINTSINHVKTRRTIEENINHAMDEADLSGILKEISNPRTYQKDQSGYFKACKDVNSINKRIKALANDKDVSHFGQLFGQRITVLISYLLFMIILFFTLV